MFYHPNMLSGMDAGYGITKRTMSHSFQPLKGAKDRSSAVHKTLIPVDGSQSANRAIEYAIDLAHRGWTSEIHLLNVQPLVLREEFAFDQVVRAEHQTRMAAGREILNCARAVLHDNGLDSKMVMDFGPPADAIVRYARQRGIDLIVMGTRGKRTFSSVLSRSVSVRVARLAEVPVTILRWLEEPGTARKRTATEVLQPVPAH